MSDSIRTRQYMLTQNLNKLPYNLDTLKEIVVQLNAEEWAYIVHDRDKSTNDEKEMVKAHVHCVLKFKNPQTLDTLAEKLKVKPQYLSVWKGRINNAYSYLIHLTDNARNKHIYDPKEVVASFDFQKRIDEITKSVSKQVVNDALNMYANGGISLEELKVKIGNLQFAKKLDEIKKLNSVLDQQAHANWLKEFEGKKMEVEWYYGSAGVGKTRLAVKHAQEYGDEYCVLGSSNDYFQDYQSQDHIVVLDELRPNDFKYSDLLKILDPFQHDKHAPRRYHNVALNIERLIITTPYSPKMFYEKTKIADRKVDTFKQLERRISNVVHVTKTMAKKEFSENNGN